MMPPDSTPAFAAPATPTAALYNDKSPFNNNIHALVRFDLKAGIECV